MIYNKTYFMSGLFVNSSIFTDFNPNVIGINLPCLSRVNFDAAIHYYKNKIENNSTVIAWSCAGLFAMYLKNNHPHKIKKLLLLNCSPKLIGDISWPGINKVEFDQLIKTAEINPIKFKKKFSWLCAYPFTGDHLYLMKYINIMPHYIEFANLCKSLDLRDEFKALGQSTSLIISEKDAVIKAREEDIKKINDNIEILPIKNAGHTFFRNMRIPI